MRFNVNVNLDSVEDLMTLTKALKEAATLQAIVKLENQIKALKAEKKHVQAVVQKLRSEQRLLEGDLGGGLDEDKDAKEPESDSSSFESEADRLIEEIDEAVEDEVIERTEI